MHTHTHSEVRAVLACCEAWFLNPFVTDNSPMAARQHPVRRWAAPGRTCARSRLASNSRVEAVASSRTNAAAAKPTRVADQAAAISAPAMALGPMTSACGDSAPNTVWTTRRCVWADARQSGRSRGTGAGMDGRVRGLAGSGLESSGNCAPTSLTSGGRKGRRPPGPCEEAIVGAYRLSARHLPTSEADP